jgi:oligoendopeptidase F
MLAEILNHIVAQLNTLMENSWTLRAYINAFVATDSYNSEAKKAFSKWEQNYVRLQRASTRFRGWVGTLGNFLPEALKFEGIAKDHAFPLNEMAAQSKYMMSQEEEELAAELGLSGAGAWSKLHGTVTSQLGIEFELDETLKKLPMPALINLRNHPDETTRRRAYEAEMEAWETVKEPIAAALNGVKGYVNTLNRRRGREDALHSAIDQARIDRETLETMLGAMEESFPVFRKYYKAKANRLGKKQLAWWDLFAPMGAAETRYTFPQAAEFIVEQFRTFSPDLADFARDAISKKWIDAVMRDGKRAGAFCMNLPKVKESRILCNFDGSMDSVFTLAHELGHGYHNYCKKEKTILLQTTPMTSLVKNSQLIVDIYSRYLFEAEVFKRRGDRELTADEFCEIMERAQDATYGDGLDERYRHKYMWIWKPHYYRPGLSFYNFPYAFGLLFGIGLYTIYRERREDFLTEYKGLLASTGEGTAADLANRFGIDIRKPFFWENSLNVIGERIERYIKL